MQRDELLKMAREGHKTRVDMARYDARNKRFGFHPASPFCVAKSGTLPNASPLAKNEVKR